MTALTVSVIQCSSVPLLADNLAKVETLLRLAKQQGAELAVLPENVGCMAAKKRTKLEQANTEENHEAVKLFSALARELNLWLVAGSIGVLAGDDKMYNRNLVFDPSGSIVARYDKIHLYDADPKPGEIYRESAEIVAGDEAKTVDTPWGKLGLSICYDMRFAALYRALAKAGANIITCPAAFTETTGRAHWHVLLRARAIETGAFILASAQCGTHENGRRTYGHSMVVAPWGEVVGELGQDEEGVLTTTLDLSKVDEARRAVPSLLHDRAFKGP